jgi:rod shape-determining protein MreC
LAFLVFISIILIGVDQRTVFLQKPRFYMSLVMYPVRASADFPLTALESLGNFFQSHTALRKELEEIRTRELLQSARLQKMDALETENNRLRSLLNASFQVGERVSIAELIKVSLDPYRHLVVINRGEREGVFIGQPVLDAGGVVGQVIRVSRLGAEVILISDPSHAIPVQNNRTGMRSIAFGTGNINRLDLPYIANNTDIQPGDILVTSGLGGVFPVGFPVARVDEVLIDSGRPFAQVTAVPTARLDRIREVLMIWRHRSPDSDIDSEPSARETSVDGAPLDKESILERDSE